MKLSGNPRNQPPPLPPLPDVVLASQSLGRRTLLEKLGLRFRVAVARLDEDLITERNLIKTLEKRAAAKASEVTGNPRVYHLAEDRPTLVIGADSMAILGKRAFGKSRNREQAKVMLKSLMGRTHLFTTAVKLVLWEQNRVKKIWEKTVATKVTLRKLPAAELESYLTRYDFSRFAAGYTLNETPWDLVTKIDGSYTNVIGLPFEVLLPALRTLKIIL